MTMFEDERRKRIEELRAGGPLDAGPVMPDPVEAQPMLTELPMNGEGKELPPEIMTGGGPTNPNGVDFGAAGRVIGTEQVQQALQILLKYKERKVELDRRIIAAQSWWQRNNWRQIEKDGKAHAVTEQQRTSTGWLVNSIIGKHADAMDAYPEPVILPREEADKEEAKILSEVIPVILKQNDFEQVYSEIMWQKFQEGTGAVCVAWDKDKLNGLGDVTINRVNVLNLYWEPGVTDIQRSRNVFLVTSVDNDLLEEQYPQLKDQLKTPTFSVSEYESDKTIDKDGKSLVVDWYYRKNNGGRTVLHYVKFVGDEVLYASEDDKETAERGWYDDGMYPFVLDVCFPITNSPAGMGYIDLAKDIQTDIDIMNSAMVANVEAGARARYFGRNDGGVNEEEMADTTKQIVHVEGPMDEAALLPIQVPSIPSYATTMLGQKIDEIKFVTGNTDVMNGNKPSGVTAASAMAVLAETGGRSSKDSSMSAYRAYAKIVTMVIERIRQFYDVPRIFRITGQQGDEFVQFDNSGMQAQPMPMIGGMDPMMGMDEEPMMRLPVYDIEVDAQRENPYSKAAQNELAIQLFQLGVFNPQMADQTAGLLEMMDFKGKDELLRKVMQNGTMLQLLQQIAAIALVLASKYEPMTGAQIQQMLASNPNTAAMAQQVPMQTMPPVEAGNGPDASQDVLPGASKAATTRINNTREAVANASRPE